MPSQTCGGAEVAKRGQAADSRVPPTGRLSPLAKRASCEHIKRYVTVTNLSIIPA